MDNTAELSLTAFQMRALLHDFKPQEFLAEQQQEMYALKQRLETNIEMLEGDLKVTEPHPV